MELVLLQITVVLGFVIIGILIARLSNEKKTLKHDVLKLQEDNISIVKRILENASLNKESDKVLLELLNKILECVREDFVWKENVTRNLNRLKRDT